MTDQHEGETRPQGHRVNDDRVRIVSEYIDRLIGGGHFGKVLCNLLLPCCAHEESFSSRFRNGNCGFRCRDCCGGRCPRSDSHGSGCDRLL